MREVDTNADPKVISIDHQTVKTALLKGNVALDAGDGMLHLYPDDESAYDDAGVLAKYFAFSGHAVQVHPAPLDTPSPDGMLELGQIISLIGPSAEADYAKAKVTLTDDLIHVTAPTLGSMRRTAWVEALTTGKPVMATIEPSKSSQLQEAA